ncbi:MAG: peptide chain release factor N(5)-glutamine methyltransferase [Acidimicrobiia bacterium]|nr:peptide chain release factor N(5)-glutamine methyltransferase [Acidimicrobiia bacterium]
MSGADEPGADKTGAEAGPGPLSWEVICAEAVDRLAARGFAAAPREVDWILEVVAGIAPGDRSGRAELATSRRLARFDAMVERRLGGEPLQYVLGSWSFRQLDLMVDRRVLIPRPETEVVAGLALAEIDRVVQAVGADRDRRVPVVDLGTGSGAIGLALAYERPTVDVWLTDNSAESLAVARANLAGIGRPAVRVQVAEGDWFDALPDELAGAVGVVVSNPPYVAAGEDLPAEVRDWEPPAALVSGPSGMECFEAIVGPARRWLRPGGALVVEHAPHQAEALAQLARRAGFSDVGVHPDLSGRPRALVAR